MVFKTQNLITSAFSGCLFISTLASLPAQALEPAAETQSKPVTVYFTRNAEKKAAATPFVGDEVCSTSTCAEELTDKGLHRANLLASWFLQRRVIGTLDAVYASQKRRTYQTALPTATLADLDVIQLPYGGTEFNPESTTSSVCDTLDTIINTPSGDTILIAGHSDTLYDIMGDGNNDCNGLGLLTDDEPGTHRFPKDSEGKIPGYGDVWKVVIRNVSARFIYRVNLETTQLTVIDRAR